MKKDIITYERYGFLLNRLEQLIIGNLPVRHIDGIYGPVRGGLPIAVHLSHYLKIPFFDEFDLFTIDKKTVLFVDDIVDTGKTLKTFIEWTSVENSAFEKIYSASLFYKHRSIIKPDVFVEEISNDMWIVFPWERNDEVPNREI